MSVWGAVAATLASSLDRRYAVWTDRVDDAGELRAKQRRREGRSPLKIVCAGRAAEMKGTLDWIEALAEAARLRR